MFKSTNKASNVVADINGGRLHYLAGQVTAAIQVNSGRTKIRRYVFDLAHAIESTRKTGDYHAADMQYAIDIRAAANNYLARKVAAERSTSPGQPLGMDA